MSKAYCLLNHALTENQINELKEKFAVAEIIYPSQQLSGKWSQIPTTENIDKTVIDSVTAWLVGAEENDVLIVQGEFGSTFAIVDFALKKGLIAVHAVTQRIATESRDGEKVSRSYIFEHVCFRRYKYFNQV